MKSKILAFVLLGLSSLPALALAGDTCCKPGSTCCSGACCSSVSCCQNGASCCSGDCCAKK